MKRLLLLRHTKAVSGSGKGGDRLRALNERGRRDAPRVAAAMQHSLYLPNRVLCSTATRAVQTWEHIAPELDGKATVVFLDELYLAPWKKIADVVRTNSETARVVMVVGHNPGLEECALALAQKPRSEAERQRLQALADKFPTGALAVLDFEIDDWSAIEPGAGVLVDLLKPKDLRAE